jgi:hypothetical protein
MKSVKTTTNKQKQQEDFSRICCAQKTRNLAQNFYTKFSKI